MQLIFKSILELIIIIILFLVLVTVLGFIFNKIRENSSHKIFNLEEYLPKEEIHTLKQIFFLIMIGLCFINVLYSFFSAGSEIIYFVFFDIALSVYIAITLDKSSLKNRILVLLLVPYGSLCYLFFMFAPIAFIDIIHIPVFIYFMKVYYDKFMEYTESHGLGIAICLLFSLVFISFLLTQIVEDVNPLDSLVMVSNAFTSNGYAVLGNSIVGKFNAIVLVWGGYILSGVGTATLTAAILTRHFNKRFDKLEEMIKKNDED